jgi:hypothetical protein
VSSWKWKRSVGGKSIRLYRVPMRSIRGGMGLGDALYVQSVARYFVQRGEKLAVCTEWPDVFRPLGDMVKIKPFTRMGVQILAHYSLRKGIKDTDQFQDCCIQAKIKEPVELRLDWRVIRPELIADLRRHGKPIALVQLPRSPMGRKDGFGAELLPDCRAIQNCIDALRGRYTVVQVGSGKPLYEFTGIDVDLANKTTVCDLIDIASAADLFLGYVSFMVPLAESFDKPALFVWSRRGLSAPHPYIQRITPSKILHKRTSFYVMDDDPNPTAALEAAIKCSPIT